MERSISVRNQQPQIKTARFSVTLGCHTQSRFRSTEIYREDSGDRFHRGTSAIVEATYLSETVGGERPKRAESGGGTTEGGFYICSLCVVP